jgi:hypothetical protein
MQQAEQIALPESLPGSQIGNVRPSFLNNDDKGYILPLPSSPITGGYHLATIILITRVHYLEILK